MLSQGRRFVCANVLRNKGGFVKSITTLPLVSVQQGQLQGTIEQTPSGTKYASFKGVPYAAPPVKKLRFAPPKPVEKWSGIRDASKHGPAPFQVVTKLSKFTEMSEDCLHLNVYSPDITAKNLPVMVWIFGGMYISGTADTAYYGPDYLVDEGVIVVTINYRLGPFGFLCLDNEEVPGNAGLKDQAMALRWVKENITKFGGDPDNLTVFGESMGGTCASLHALSPMSKDLVDKIIVQSGGYVKNPFVVLDSKRRALKMAEALNVKTKDMDELVKVLRSAPADMLAKAPGFLMRGPYGASFSHVVEKSSNGEDCFLPEEPLELLRQGKMKNMPVLIGGNSNEGIFLRVTHLRYLKAVNYEFNKLLPPILIKQLPDDVLKSVGEKVKKHFFGEKVVADSEIEMCDMITSEGCYTVFGTALEMAKMESFPVYAYKMCYDNDNLCYYKKLYRGTHIKGMSHVDDNFRIFKTDLDLEIGEKELKSIKKTVRLWTNFAKHGNPTPDGDSMIRAKWKPLTKEGLNYMNIDDILELKTDHLPNPHHEFWQSIYKDVAKYL